ncbi:ATP-binding protein [Streptomyces sp. NPDC005202]|uniref:ATP-binding protein n=1 Tax=Streptomyces sp. NPDC005202 TaxID=3157021 RepID=UPI0033AB6C4B
MGRLNDELTRLGRILLIVVDEVGYIPFEPEAANLFFQFISGRYERASVIVTSSKPFGRWGEVFGDDTVAAAMIDRLVHYAEVISLKGDSYRMRGRDLGRVPAANTGKYPTSTDGPGSEFADRQRVQVSETADTSWMTGADVGAARDHAEGRPSG